MEFGKFDFEKLIVYQKSLEFIHKIFEIYKKLPREFQYTIEDNLIRAGMSIANNIAEGSGKRSKKENARYFSTSLDSSRECVSVFNVLFNEKLILEEVFRWMRLDAKEITNMLHGLIDAQPNRASCWIVESGTFRETPGFSPAGHPVG